ncbi:hypothetical protein [Aquibacillus rhizosphaerae]|uniref:Uncharacterized protein n=1 Tax=Aquibacillus rhizosphaerae TaxID=3051431 RepID=A0ABT7LB55_9BACI|nr:hypothetical protein [Aquibacillus sp. LR5S19]MDL4842482.1 hypothetical protein [Aquibacillus sp. LR5S19]
METIYIHEVIKFGKYEHMKALQEGKIFARPLGYFQDIERKELDKAMRHDQYEGTDELYQPKVMMEKGESVFVTNPEGNVLGDITSSILGPMKMSSGYLTNTPVFCMFSIHSELLRAYEKGLIETLIGQRVKEFGNYVLIITDYNEFIERIDKLCKKYSNRKLSAVPGVVEYVDTKTFHGKYGVFKKPLEYSYQNEFRIVFDGLSISSDHSIIAEIDDISDISKLMPYKQFRKSYRVRMKNLEFDPFLPYKLQQPRTI